MEYPDSSVQTAQVPVDTRGSPLQISVSGNGEATTVWLAGELDLASRSAFVATLEVVMEATRHIEVDVAKLDFVDAAGLGAFISSRRHAQSNGISLVLRHPPATMARLLELTGLTSLLTAPEVALPATQTI